MASTKKGVLHSVYFHTKAELTRAKQAARVAGVRLSVFMRESILTRAERVIAKGKKAA